MEANYEQIMALGRGLEPDGSVLYDSPTSGDSYDRGAAVGNYAALHRQSLRRVIMSGGYSFVLEATDSVPAGSEADGMLDVAHEHGLADDVETHLDTTSLTTFGNFLNTAHLFTPGETVGLVLHRDHVERALRVAHKVVPRVVFEPIFADNPRRATNNGRVGMKELASGLVYGAAMLPVRRGDLDHIRRQDERVQHLVLGGLRLQHKLVKNATPQSRAA